MQLVNLSEEINKLARSANISGQVRKGRRLEQTLADVYELITQLRALKGGARR